MAAACTIQALWTAAPQYRCQIICNNRSYQILKLNLQYWRERRYRSTTIHLLSVYATRTSVSMLAWAMGFRLFVEKPDQIGSAIQKALDHSGPFLI